MLASMREVRGGTRGTSMDGNTTCWTLIRAAADGDASQRDAFARRYLPVVRAWLEQRWRSPAQRQRVDDAVQDVFMECLREEGALGRAAGGTRKGFAAFLYGVTRNIARRHEQKQARNREDPAGTVPDDPATELSQSRAFDRLWARSLIQEARARHGEQAEQSDEAARRRVALLEERFGRGRPIRDIAKDWSVSADRLHHDYAQARKEFHRALRDVVRYHYPDDPTDPDARCQELLELLG